MLNQRKFTACSGKTKVHYYVDKPIDARDYPHFDQFVEVIRKRFTELFYEVKAKAAGKD